MLILLLGCLADSQSTSAFIASGPGNDSDGTDNEMDLFSYLSETPTNVTPIASQLDSYLSSKVKTIESLRDYPAVANAFMKANSTLPSSAVVERLFSAAGQILNSRRCSLSDEHFDWMVFLRDRLKNKSKTIE